MSHADRIAREVAAVYAFYDRELGDAALAIWADVLADFHPSQVVAALKAHMADPDAGHYCPKPADVIRQIRGNVDEAATLAWADVLRAVRSGDGMSAFDPAAIMALQSLGGVSVVRRADESHNGFLQARFVEAYKAFRHRHERNGIASLASNGRRIKGQ
jgi:hypothetical protein